MLMLLLVCGAAGVGLAAQAQSPGARLRPLTWAHDTQFKFAIYNAAEERYATAYYRILKETSNGRELYHFKYMGRNDNMSESAEVWVDPQTLYPLRSTRKVATSKRTLYVDVAYDDERITVRHKYEGQPVTEMKLPTGGAKYYDFEELIWLIPQIDWQQGETSTYINYFNSFRFQRETTVVRKEGSESIKLFDRSYPATRFRFDVGSSKYTLWTVDQQGQAVPARVLMDDSDDRKDVTFVNLGLDHKLVRPAGGGGA